MQHAACSMQQLSRRPRPRPDPNPKLQGSPLVILTTSPHLARDSVLDCFLHGTGLDIFLRKTPETRIHATHSLPPCCPRLVKVTAGCLAWALAASLLLNTLNSEDARPHSHPHPRTHAPQRVSREDLPPSNLPFPQLASFAGLTSTY
jgi:hypothetical protein